MPISRLVRFQARIQVERGAILRQSLRCVSVLLNQSVFAWLLQRRLLPAMWIPWVRRPHYYFEEWEVEGSPAECFDAIRKMVIALNDSPEQAGFHYEVFKEKHNYISINCYTKGWQWLDIIEFSFKEPVDGKTPASIVAYSTGMVPLRVPGAILINPFICWIPFDDHEIPILWWFPSIHKTFALQVTTKKVGRKL
jgi:hypothetical protein